jgi:hypothetical protein
MEKSRVALDFKGRIDYISPPENTSEDVRREQEDIVLNKHLSDLAWLMQAIMNREKGYDK